MCPTKCESWISSNQPFRNQTLVGSLAIVQTCAKTSSFNQGQFNAACAIPQRISSLLIRHLCLEKLLSFGDLLQVQYSFCLLFHRECHQQYVDLCLMALQQAREVILRSQLLQFHHRILVSFISAGKNSEDAFCFLKCYRSFPINNSYCDIYPWSRGYIFCEL